MNDAVDGSDDRRPPGRRDVEGAVAGGRSRVGRKRNRSAPTDSPPGREGGAMRRKRLEARLRRSETRRRTRAQALKKRKSLRMRGPRLSSGSPSSARCRTHHLLELQGYPSIVTRHRPNSNAPGARMRARSRRAYDQPRRRPSDMACGSSPRRRGSALAVAGLACSAPARRATRISPWRR